MCKFRVSNILLIFLKFDDPEPEHFYKERVYKQN